MTTPDQARVAEVDPLVLTARAGVGERIGAVVVDVLAPVALDKAQMRDGAEIWEVLDDGTQRLFAVLRAGEWIPVG